LKAIIVAGTRPNFIKVAPLYRALQKCPDFAIRIVHTGQHFDYAMSGIFFEQLQLPQPDYFLGVGAGSHTGQTAAIMVAFEKVIRQENPDFIIVVGDVNSTLACALTGVKEQVPTVHIEAGLRSGDRSMPEEINRIVTDAVSDQLFVTERSAIENLLKENISPARIHWVGNLMIDSLIDLLPEIDRSSILTTLALDSQSYFVMTMHRPSNVDNEAGLSKILQCVRQLSKLKPVVFPVHPRTRKNMKALGLLSDFEAIVNLKVLEPQGYIEFVHLTKHAALVITDSGGIQEETTFLNVPCITLRESTERPVTLEIGTNHLLKEFDVSSVLQLTEEILGSGVTGSDVPEFWDGRSAERIVSILREKYINSYVCDK
jgi:UDP-N-acetylglucosamine 2-epimerase (non-hydrolysing)